MQTINLHGINNKSNGVGVVRIKLTKRFAHTVTPHAQNQRRINATKGSKKSFLAVTSAQNQR